MGRNNRRMNMKRLCPYGKMNMRVSYTCIFFAVIFQYFVLSQPTTSTENTEVPEQSNLLDFSQLRTEIGEIKEILSGQDRRFDVLQEKLEKFIDQFSNCSLSKTRKRQQHTSEIPPSYKIKAPDTRPELSSGLVTSVEITDRWAYGVTKLLDNIYVLGYSPNSILVFKDDPPFQMRVIEAPQMRNPFSMVACNRTNVLFVLDIGKHCIWKMTVDDEHISLWLDNVRDADSLSAAMHGGVLLLRENEMLAQLEIYRAHGVLTTTVPLDELVGPLCAAETNRGTFIVSHRLDDDDEYWILSELNMEGDILRTSEEDDEDSRLNRPAQLFIDQDDRIFVADQGSNRVVIFDMDLRWNRTIPGEDVSGTKSPMRLFYDGVDSQLVVLRGDRGGEQMDIYDFQ